MSWNHRIFHLPFRIIFCLESMGFLPKRLLGCQNNPPLCVACQFGASHCRFWQTKGNKVRSIRTSEQTNPGYGVSLYQIISDQLGLIPQMSGFLTSQFFRYAKILWITLVNKYIYIS